MYILFRRHLNKKRRRWPKDQEAKVKEIFSDFIAQKKCPPKAEAKQHIHEFPHCNGNYRNLIMKVNNLITSSKGRYLEEKKKKK